MTVIPAPISELDLHAWADGALSPERSTLVEDWLRAHPAAAADVRQWRLQVDALRRLYPLPEPETMSLALRRSVDRAAGRAPEAPPEPRSSGRRHAGLAAAAAALALALGAMVAFQGGTASDSLADRALRLHQTFRLGAAEPASLAGVGSAGPDLSGAGFVLRGVRTVPGEAAGYAYEGQGGARLTLVIGRRRESREEFTIFQRGDTAWFGWQDQRAAFVLVGPAPGARLLPVAHLVQAGLTGQALGNPRVIPSAARAGVAPGVRPASHHRMVPGLLQRCDTGLRLRTAAAGGG